jgi:flagellar FliL protein
LLNVMPTIMPDDDITAVQPAPAPKKSGRAKFVVLLLVLLLAGGGAAGTWILRSRRSAPPAKPAVKAVMHLEPFVLNLADPSQKIYLRVGVDLGLDVDAEKEKQKEVSPPPTAQVRDTILSVLMVARPEDLATPEGKAKLKQDLLKSVQEREPELGVREVYFTEFLIQS